jgi:GntR family transcriptional regulator, transcriptional repressor for pyruvate dehydrogenase complex
VIAGRADEVERTGEARTPRRRAEYRRAHKAALEIAQQIADDISDNGLKPGTRLATERDMLERFAAGRGTVRESLRFLEMNGAIVVRPGPQGGPFVAEPGGHDLAGVLGLFMQMRGLRFKSLIGARETLEPELAALAAANHSPAQLAEIADSIHGMAKFLSDERNFLAENDRFHGAVAAASGNDLFALLITSLHNITDGVPLGMSYSLPRRETVLRSHQEIYEAISVGDADAARHAMSGHMRRFRSRVENDFPEVYERVVRWREVAP